MAVRKQVETKQDQGELIPDALVTVRVNRDAVEGMVREAATGRIEMLYRAFIKSKAFVDCHKNGPDLPPLPHGEPSVTWPNHLDLERWAASLCKDHPDLEFARQVFNLACQRLSPAVQTRIQLEER